MISNHSIFKPTIVTEILETYLLNLREYLDKILTLIISDVRSTKYWKKNKAKFFLIFCEKKILNKYISKQKNLGHILTKKVLKKTFKNILIILLQVIVSFAFFRLMQFVVRWYLFGKCTFRTFSYFGFRNARIARRAGDSRELTVRNSDFSKKKKNSTRSKNNVSYWKRKRTCRLLLAWNDMLFFLWIEFWRA